MNAAKDDHVCFRLGGLAAQPERVTDEIRDVLNLGALVVVRDDHRVALSREVPDLFLQPGVRVVRRIYHSMCLPLHFRFARGKSLL